MNTTETDELTEDQRNWLVEKKHYDDLTENASWCFGGGWVLLAATVIMVIIAVNNNNDTHFFYVAGGVAFIAIICFIMAQVFHIRAALQKLFLK